eukprot:CAMPEP_0198682240 /NCGR_PEP_ID=MMETSP1468-20131203/8334_1 /TAXON_ID=1461545 /ORGANISM="Mantoniella sp, Strain CCMP1436" /LENGTH=73 /DNA_ID=CAMNT_0044424957 /DNA_START=53 /DNA_END=271 /DNA_ORIENTATION=+
MNVGGGKRNVRAGTAGAVEAVVAAMRTHAGSADVQEAACLTGGNVKYIAHAGLSGAVEALGEAMRRHTESPGV